MSIRPRAFLDTPPSAGLGMNGEAAKATCKRRGGQIKARTERMTTPSLPSPRRLLRADASARCFPETPHRATPPRARRGTAPASSPAPAPTPDRDGCPARRAAIAEPVRSEEHTSELQSLM